MKNKHETLDIEKYIKPPIAKNTLKLCNHISRYTLAIEHLNISDDDVVMDCSCGIGYGTLFLASKAKMAIGADIADSYLEEANKHYKKNNLTYINYKHIYGEITVDKIVCIETLEHIAKESIQEFIVKLLSYLKRGGDLFISTPVGLDKPSTCNKFHLNEMSIGTLHGLFKNKFKRITFKTFDYTNSFNHKEQYCTMLLKEKI